MILIILLIVFMVISTILVIAAGMLSSRLSRQEGWSEEFNIPEHGSTDTIPETID